MFQRFQFGFFVCESYFYFCFVVAGTVSGRMSAHRTWLPIGPKKSYSVLNVFGSFGWKREGTVPEKIGHASILQRLQVCEIYTPTHAPVGLVIGATLLAVVNAQNSVAIFPHADSLARRRHFPDHGGARLHPLGVLPLPLEFLPVLGVGSRPFGRLASFFASFPSGFVSFYSFRKFGCSHHGGNTMA